MTRLFTICFVAVLLSGVPSASRAEPQRFAVQKEESTVTFRTRALERIVGSTTHITGTIMIDPSNPQQRPTAAMVIETGSLKTGNRRRDEDMHRRALETSTYPEIRVQALAIETDASRLGATPIKFDVTARLTLHGTTQEITFPVKARLVGDTLSVEGSTSLRMTDYGIRPPRLLVLAVRNLTEITFHIVALAQG